MLYSGAGDKAVDCTLKIFSDLNDVLLSKKVLLKCKHTIVKPKSWVLHRPNICMLFPARLILE